jgi:hypothetical protein
MTELEKYEAVNKTETVEELQNVILSLADEQGMVMGRTRPFHAAQQAKNLEIVMEGYPANLLTRSYGIRQQALYIAYYKSIDKLDNNRAQVFINKNKENER